MSYSFVIRRASMNDLEAIMLLLEDLDYRIENRENFKHLAYPVLKENPMWAVFIAFHSDRPVGFVTIHIKPALRLAGYMASIEELVVQNNLRNMGVGSALLERALSYSDGLHCKRIEVLSSKKRESYKRNFYIKHGFIEHPSAVFRINK